MRFRRPQAVEPEIQLAPLIDVILLLLLFYSVTATFSDQPRIALELPKSGTANLSTGADGIVIAVDREGRWAIDERAVRGNDLAALEAALRSTLAALPADDKDARAVTILGDAAAPHQAIVMAMDAARRNGVASVRIATRDAAGEDGG